MAHFVDSTIRVPEGHKNPRPLGRGVCQKGMLMERYAIFVDAGYLLAEAGDLLFDTLNRTEQKRRPSCNYEELFPRLEKLAGSVILERASGL